MEKKLEGVLICIVLCILTSVCFDMYFLHFNIDIPPVLLPMLSVFSLIFFLLLVINGLKYGNLVLRCTTYNWLSFSIIVNQFIINPIKTHTILARITGVTCILFVILGIYILITKI
ncbi:MAG: hypothetical protein KA264_00790 [Crocinitomicaceae bacterium]|nr:hypothetical protein [Crocinitomicaceae bacterium]